MHARGALSPPALRPRGPCRPGPVSHSDDLNLDGRITIDRAGQSSLQCCPRVWACSGGVDLVPAAAGEPASPVAAAAQACRPGAGGAKCRLSWARDAAALLAQRTSLQPRRSAWRRGPVRGVDRSRRHRGRHSPSFGPPPRQHRSLPASPSALACCTCPSFSCNWSPGLAWGGFYGLQQAAGIPARQLARMLAGRIQGSRGSIRSLRVHGSACEIGEPWSCRGRGSTWVSVHAVSAMN